MIAFSEAETDLITEFTNIAMGRAAASLSDLVADEVGLTIPSFELLSRDQMVQRCYSMGLEKLCGIDTRFGGEIDGTAYLLFPEHQSLELVRHLLHEDVPIETFTETERDALIEVGNIILNAFLGELVNQFGLRIDNTVPDLRIGSPGGVLSGESGAEEMLMLFRIEFNLTTRAISGYIVMVLDVASAEMFKTLSASHLAAHGLA